jgi:hypothetical protein
MIRCSPFSGKVGVHCFMPRGASAAEDAMQWYYTVQGQRQGPVDDAGLEDLVRQGVIRDDSYVWREGLAEWQLYGTIKPKPTPAPTPPPPRPEPAAGGMGAPPPARPSSVGPAPPYVAPPYVAPPVAVKPAGDSKSYLFYYPVLRALGNGGVIRTCVVWGLKIAAVAAVLVALLSAFGVLTVSQGTGASGMLGAVVLALVVIATSLCVAQVCWFRAGSIEALRDADYTLIPMASILFRMGGECGATAFAGLGIGACLFLWLSPGGGLGGLPLPIGLPVPSGFLGGILALLYSALLAFLSLISGYLAAEWTVVLVDIAESIHKIRRVAEKAE